MSKNWISKVGFTMGAFLLTGLSMVMAEEVTGAGNTAEVVKYLAISAGFGLGLAIVGCGLAQGKLVSSAMEGIARNPGAARDMFVPMILGLAFIEALGIFALIFSFVFKAAFGL